MPASHSGSMMARMLTCLHLIRGQSWRGYYRVCVEFGINHGEDANLCAHVTRGQAALLVNKEASVLSLQLHAHLKRPCPILLLLRASSPALAALYRALTYANVARVIPSWY
eukprot:1300448-Rhodomonas_salina.6